MAKDLIVGIALIVLFPGSYFAGWVKGYKSVPPYAVAKTMIRPVPTEKEWEKVKILKGFKVAKLWLLRTAVTTIVSAFILSILISGSFK
jgi:hypothetical protein